MNTYLEIEFKNGHPDKGVPTFCIIAGDLMVLEWQGNGYPLYNSDLDRTVYYRDTDVWLIKQ